MRGALLLAAGALVLAAAPSSWENELRAWRDAYEASLKAPDGWLSVAGLFWLHEGDNAVGSDPLSPVVLREGLPKQAGVLRLRSGVVTFEPASGPPVVLRHDSPDAVHLGSLTMTIIRRGDRIGARLKDPESAARRNFTGCQWFPPDAKWRIEARWIPYPTPNVTKLLNVLGMTIEETSPGYAEFTVGDKPFHLEPITEKTEQGEHLFFLMKDATAGRTTYAAGRYLYAAMPSNGIVELDFNKAENPPCAFTSFATCPLPPRQNILPLAIEAGEKKYEKH